MVKLSRHSAPAPACLQLVTSDTRKRLCTQPWWDSLLLLLLCLCSQPCRFDKHATSLACTDSCYVMLMWLCCTLPDLNGTAAFASPLHAYRCPECMPSA